jgi:hypothetical protein
MNWKEFESFVASAFSSLGFATEKNVRLRKPRAEIDVVSSRDGLAFAVDCKHWKRTVGRATMLGAAERQLARAKRLASELGYHRVVPIIVTMKDESLRILENGVPIVPIHMISDFILNWEEASGEMAVLVPKTRQRKLK